MSWTPLCSLILLSCALTPTVSQKSCGGRCGVEYYRGYLCQCDYGCMAYGECCLDFEAYCTSKETVNEAEQPSLGLSEGNDEENDEVPLVKPILFPEDASDEEPESTNTYESTPAEPLEAISTQATLITETPRVITEAVSLAMTPSEDVQSNTSDMADGSTATGNADLSDVTLPDSGTTPISDQVPDTPTPTLALQPEHSPTADATWMETAQTDALTKATSDTTEGRPSFSTATPNIAATSEPSKEPSTSSVPPDPSKESSTSSVAPEPSNETSTPSVSPEPSQESFTSSVSQEPSQESSTPSVSTEPSQESATPSVSLEPSQESSTPSVSTEPSQESATPSVSPEPSQESPTPSVSPEPSQESSTSSVSPEPSQESSTPSVSPEPSQESSTPSVSTEPSQESATPSVSPEPSQESSTPSVSTEPSQESATPSVSPEPPQESSTPSVSPEPSQESSTPSVSPEPSQESSTPSVSPEPSQESSTPSVSTEPSQESATPSVSPEPSQESSTPSVSTEPSQESPTSSVPPQPSQEASTPSVSPEPSQESPTSSVSSELSQVLSTTAESSQTPNIPGSTTVPPSNPTTLLFATNGPSLVPDPQNASTGVPSVESDLNATTPILPTTTYTPRFDSTNPATATQKPTQSVEPASKPQDDQKPLLTTTKIPVKKPDPKPTIKPVVPVLTVDTSRDFQADDNNDTNLCSGRPTSAVTTLRNGTIVVFRGHYFWSLDRNRSPGPARDITQAWGIPSPIDTAFTRCNCQGKTYIFKGNQYWRFENNNLDLGYPKAVEAGFDGLRGHITAALSVPQHRSRRESVYFFKRGGLVQKYSYKYGGTPCNKKPQPQYTIYTVRHRMARHAASHLGPTINIRMSWRGFPTTVTSAVSVPSYREPEGYKYYVLSRTKSYNVKMYGDQPAVASPRENPTAQSNFINCPNKL
ncbi:proteoglycan 4b [Stigmatopora argus]